MGKASTNNPLHENTPDNAREQLVSGLLNPQAYDHATDAIHLKETHGAWVLLTGNFAYKIKKPVNFGFLDYSTLEKRRISCEEELRLNRRFAPQIYLDVVPVRGTNIHPRIGGAGPVIEYAVKMLQFPERGLLSDLADSGVLNAGLIDQMIARVAAFHQSTAVAPPESPFGEPGQIRHWVVENFTHILTNIDEPDDIAAVENIQRWVNEQYKYLEAQLSVRKQCGFIRECHGDLHLGNMTLVDDEVILFDCIEFNPELRWIDVISEVAFVVMDLEERGFPGFANRFLNGYLQYTGDYGGLSLLAWYLVYRALVRAKVAVLRGQQENNNPGLVQQLHADYLRYMQLAESYTRPRDPMLLLMHGLSGSGKTTAARWLCETNGMIHLRSDIERKRMVGLAPLDRTAASVGEGIYTGAQTERTYSRLLELAEAVITTGFMVVVDATFLTRHFREVFITLARERGIPCMILACEAPAAVLDRRVPERDRLGMDASEATLDVLAAQRSNCDALTREELAISLRIDTDTMAYQNHLLLDLEAGIERIKQLKKQ